MCLTFCTSSPELFLWTWPLSLCQIKITFTLYLKKNVMSSVSTVLPSLICLKIMFKVVTTTPVKIAKRPHVLLD